MSIDASALNSINNAIASYSSQNTSAANSNQNYLDAINKASAEVAGESRYKTAFEEKLKIATGSDEVDISDEALAALQKYNQTGETSEASEEEKISSTSTSSEQLYTYDYMTLKKQREMNQAAIDKEIEEKYASSDSSSEEEDSDSTTEESASSPYLPPRPDLPPAPPPGEDDEVSPGNPQGTPNMRPEDSNATQSEDTTIAGSDEMSESASLSDE